MAKKFGAELQDNTPVEAIESPAEHITIKANGKTFTTKKLIISAGSWANKMLVQVGR